MAGERCTKTLGEVCSTITDGAHQSPKTVQSGMPMASVKDLNFWGLNLDTARHISHEDYEALVRQGCKPLVGDVLIAKDGNSALDTVCVIEEPIEVVLLSSVAILRPDSTKIDSKYLKYYFMAPNVIDYLKSNFISGAAIPRVILRDLKRAAITLPELDDQRAIAHILGTLDDKIELNRRRSQTLEAMAGALFQDWFVDFGPVRARMAGRERNLSADLWQLFPDGLDDDGKPEGWVERPLDEVADFLNGVALQKYPATDPDDSLPVIKIAELRNGISAKSDRASRGVPAKYIIKDGDFLFSWSGSLLAKFWTEGEGALNQHLFKVTSEQYPIWFVSHWVHHHLEEFQAIAASKATTMGHIQRGHLKAAMTICPPDDVVDKMGLVMAPLVEQTIRNELESRSLGQLRDALLPELISGEQRIADAEKFVERIGR